MSRVKGVALLEAVIAPTIVSGLFVGAMAFSGCAGVTVSRDAPYRDGLRYYQPAVIFILAPDGRGGTIVKSEIIPDLTKPMVADPYSWLASNDVKLQFSNGMMTQATAKPDTAAVPKAIIESATRVLQSLVGAADELRVDAESIQDQDVEGRKVPGIQVYRLRPQGSDGFVLEGTGSHPIRVPVPIVGGES